MQNSALKKGLMLVCLLALAAIQINSAWPHLDHGLLTLLLLGAVALLIAVGVVVYIARARAANNTRH